MFTRLKRGERRWKMQKVRQANDRRFNMSILQQLVVIPVTLFRRILFIESGAARLIEIGAGVEIYVSNCTNRQRVLLSRPTGANDSNIEFFHVPRADRAVPCSMLK